MRAVAQRPIRHPEASRSDEPGIHHPAPQNGPRIGFAVRGDGSQMA